MSKEYNDLLEKYENVQKLDDIVDISIPKKFTDENDRGELNLVARSGESVGSISEEKANIVADSTTLLISNIAEPKIMRPEEKIVPTDHWFVLSFESEEDAKNYEEFFSKDIVRERLEDLSEGTAMKRIPIEKIKNFEVPSFQSV